MTDEKNSSFVPEVPFRGKAVAVLGFGLEGRSACDFLLENGASITVFDERDRGHFDEEMVVSYEEQGVVFEFSLLGPLVSYDVIVRSPGVLIMCPEIQEAIEVGVIVTSCTKIFFDLCPCEIIGVTGTKGKGTTSTLIFEILKRAGCDVYLAGNIGEGMLGLLPKLTPKSLVVLELSSFQLIDLHKSPHVAVMLMVVPEHMDYHVDFEEYLQAKRNLVRFQTPSDFAIFNHDYPASNESDIFSSGRVLYTSREKAVLEGAWVEDGSIYVNLEGGAEKVALVKDIKLVGRHNLDNVCAAVLVAKIEGVTNGVIGAVLREFGGLAHRLELVGEVNGVLYYNDSFSTIPEATIAAIEAFSEPKVLILGGSSKNSDFEELGKVISGANVRGIVGIGEEWARIRECIHSNVDIIEGGSEGSMHEIVEAASSMAQGGDVVLLSPACASFGMFKDYKERGDQFRDIVSSLK